ncbi:nucleic acid-binding, OB-fold-like protein [Artemisia annua]|uniref:Nucleic acid-binding, OB-fold-like protein n=1 Tax=Artemisia annua TaxID=35608 RepID=A0A2U1MTC9_ARTAN|nr:nucleic acid-binding, OB-fold-like protein [Artemisia annua]
MVRKPAPFLDKKVVEEPVITEESLSEIQTDVALLPKPEPFVQHDDVEEAVTDEENLTKSQTDVSLLQNLGVIGGYDATRKSTLQSTIDPTKIEGELSADMKLEDLIAIYDQEKLKYLSSFVGQKVKVNMVLADRESNKLIFYGKPKVKDESIARKKNLMAELSVGDQGVYARSVEGVRSIPT